MAGVRDDSVEIARMLNSARAIGIEDCGMTDFLQDFFGEPTGEHEHDEMLSDATDSEVEEVEEVEDIPTRHNIIFDEMEDLDLEESMVVEMDDEESAIDMASNLFEFVTVAEKTNHCKCSLFNGQRCANQFSKEESDSIRLNMQELTPFEKDLFLLGVITSSINNSEKTVMSKRKQQLNRKECRIRHFYIGQKRICRNTFLFLMQISIYKLTELKKHYELNGITPYTKKSGGRKSNKKALNLEDVQQMVHFVLNFVEEQAISLPGRIPGIHRDDVKVIPSNFTKADIWRRYRDSAADGQKIMGQSTFRKLWKKVLSYVVVAKPASDLCQTCQDNNYLIVRNVNVDEASKTETLRKQELHLLNATKERSFYRNWCNEAKEVKNMLQLTSLRPNKPCSVDVAFHYSFDFAQQVHYPSNPFQPGPIYFKTPRKCQIFGVNVEGFPAQVNYLIDEAVACGKGANVVISLFHHFLECFGIGEYHIRINADNCSGQNKNNAMLSYLCWRTLVGLHKSVHIHFLMAGHTKFAPDWCFGLFKQKFRKSFVSSLEDIANSVSESTCVSKINIPQLVGTENGEIIVYTYDWVSFLGKHFKKFIGIKDMQHFRFDCKEPGVLFYKKLLDTEEESTKFLKLEFLSSDRPEVIIPNGLSEERKAYLFKEIREYCKEGTKDLVCPNPDNEMNTEE